MEAFFASDGTVACAIFLRQQFKHSCADAELDGQAKAAAGINSLGITDARLESVICAHENSRLEFIRNFIGKNLLGRTGQYFEPYVGNGAITLCLLAPRLPTPCGATPVEPPVAPRLPTPISCWPRFVAVSAD